MSKTSVSQKQNELHKRILAALIKSDDNRVCADCTSRGPTWASINLGVFMCLQCSGIHRNLGVHISKVRSTNLDTWLPEQVEFVRATGNVKANRYWEATLPRDFRKPNEHADMDARKIFIVDKYVHGKWAAKDMTPPTFDHFTPTGVLLEGGGLSGGLGSGALAAPTPTSTSTSTLASTVAPNPTPAVSSRPTSAAPMPDLLDDWSNDFVSAAPSHPASRNPFPSAPSSRATTPPPNPTNPIKTTTTQSLTPFAHQDLLSFEIQENEWGDFATALAPPSNQQASALAELLDMHVSITPATHASSSSSLAPSKQPPPPSTTTAPKSRDPFANLL